MFSVSKVLGGMASVLIVSCCCASEINENGEATENNSQTRSEYDGSNIDGFLNLKAAHERDGNAYCWGPKNSSAVGLTPVIQIGNLTIDSDFYYGRQFKYSGALGGFKAQSHFVGDIGLFAEKYNDKPSILGNARAGSKNGVEKSHFYRNYTRAYYTDKEHDIRVVLGDTSTRNPVGFQRALSGIGISILRQGGINKPTFPIVVTRLSKAEVRLNGEILSINILRPGIYTEGDFGPEALLPGAKVKISDQLSRSEIYDVSYFGCYDQPKLGCDDFEATLVWGSKWNLDDTHRVRYEKKPRFSGNYRRTFAEGITSVVGVQVYEKSMNFDGGLIFETKYGKIAPNIGYSNARQNSEKNAFAGSIYCALPKNSSGVSLETLFAVKASGYSELSVGEETIEVYNEYIRKYFSSDQDLQRQLLNSSDMGSNRQVVARLYTKPIWNITPAFIFKGSWTTKSERVRDYTVALMTRVFDKCNLTLSGGITYDDPGKGYNQKSPDRRLTVACAIDLNSEWSAKYTYGQYYDDMRRNYGTISYAPEAIKGLELCAEYTRKPGISNPLFLVSYDSKYFCIKVEEDIVDTYKDAGSAVGKDGHKNGQRIVFGTSISTDGIRNYRKSSINALRTMQDYKKK